MSTQICTYIRSNTQRVNEHSDMACKTYIMRLVITNYVYFEPIRIAFRHNIKSWLQTLRVANPVSAYLRILQRKQLKTKSPLDRMLVCHKLTPQR